MTGTRTDFLETLRDSYSAYYDIHENESFTELPLVFRADYSSRNEKYWLTKNIKVWGNETNEHVYMFAAESFDKELVDNCIDFALADGLHISRFFLNLEKELADMTRQWNESK